MEKAVKILIRLLGLFMATFSIVVYSVIKLPYSLALWIPINVGYAIYFGRLFDDK